MKGKHQNGNASPVEPIPLGSLIPGSTTLMLQGRHVWRYGLAATMDGNQQAVFVCLCNWREMIVQTLVASIGRSIGLPIPPCFIIAADRIAFPETESDSRSYLFGCRANPHPTMGTFVSSLGEASDLLQTVRREVTNRLIILDEWAINGRRDATALLIDPSSGLLFVDSHPALQSGCDPADQLRNWVHEISNAATKELDGMRLRKEIEKSAGHIFDVDLGILADQQLFWLSDAQAAVWYQLLDYLADRRHNLETLFCNRLGIEEQQLQFAS